MTADSYSRHIPFEEVNNFRDLGGYQTQDGRVVAWRRLFRSGAFHNMTTDDLTRLREEIGLTTVIDLRSTIEMERQGVGLLSESGIEYYSLPFITSRGEGKLREPFSFSNMGEFYLFLVKHKEISRRVVEALEIIAEPENHPLVFCCAMGKDRTGILAAITLSLLGVFDEDIIEDYTLSALYMEEWVKRMHNDSDIPEFARHLPRFFFKAAPESMALFLSTLQREYGSIRGFVEAQGIDASLISRLEEALLV